MHRCRRKVGEREWSMKGKACCQECRETRQGTSQHWLESLLQTYCAVSCTLNGRGNEVEKEGADGQESGRSFKIIKIFSFFARFVQEKPNTPKFRNSLCLFFANWLFPEPWYRNIKKKILTLSFEFSKFFNPFTLPLHSPSAVRGRITKMSC